MTKALALLALLTILPTAAEAAVRTWVSPQLDGERVSSCLSNQGGCGKPAADLWCKAMGFEQALTFERERASYDYTRFADTLELAPGTPFRTIKCSSPNVTAADAG
jgi:hypothetical protein